MNDTFSIFPIEKTTFIFSKPKYVYVYYKSYRKNLINDSEEPFSLEKLQKKLNEIKLSDHQEKPHIWHLYYEWGFYYQDLIHLIGEEDILAIEICYQDARPLESSPCDDFKKAVSKINGPTFKHYSEKFEEGFKRLLKGDCYQFNLTQNYLFNYPCVNQESILDFVKHFFSQKDLIGEFAHSTYLAEEKKLFLSNSPECLFDINDDLSLQTRPIKGSLVMEDEDEFEVKWAELLASKKDEAELLMITDLLRNDLAKIDKPQVKVLKSREPLIVPGLLHQYSLIEVSLGQDVTLGNIVKALFPGGSVTGAPKKRVMAILKDLEIRNRGFYCGTTILSYGRIAKGSINIRSAEFDLDKNNFTYQSGGGVTLQSLASKEFEEMEGKVESFLQLFQ